MFLAIKQIGTESVRSHVWCVVASLMKCSPTNTHTRLPGSRTILLGLLQTHNSYRLISLCLMPLHFYLGVCKTPSTRRYSINWNGIKRLFRNPWQLINHRDSQVPYFSNPQFPLSVLANLQTTARQHKINVMNGCRKDDLTTINFTVPTGW